MREPVTIADLSEAVAGSVGTLRGGVDRGWSVPAGPLTWSCHATAVHVGDCLLGYAVQLAYQARERYVPFESAIASGAGPTDVLEYVSAAGATMVAVLRAAPPDARAWHPYGTADGEGWAAVSIVETVVHTDDVAAGLGLPYAPDEAVCARVVDRLVPGTPPDRSGWARLRWATGRLDLPGHPRPESWRWHSAPLT